jgi:alkanesulfonate monooxygenase SsuD/methylene tetrahydromethanopterin reductase-like flavin-dependent oxidoreductase (luciferase family)
VQREIEDITALITHVGAAAPLGESSSAVLALKAVLGGAPISLAAAAAVTERIRLATTTLPMPNRNEVLVAKQAAVIDRLAGGRLTLGVSLGSRPDDYQVLGRPWSIA